MCSDDRCLCTPDVICAASDCSACVGDSGRGGQIGTCYSGTSELLWRSYVQLLMEQNSRTHVIHK
jgi:hypothetical protein